MKINEKINENQWKIEHILCTRSASRTNFEVKNQFLEAVATAIDRKSIPRGQENPCRPYQTGGGGCTGARAAGASKIRSESEMQAIP